MRETIRDKERLQHILSAIQVLLANKDKHTLDEITDDPIVYYGFVKHVEMIGEAVYMLTKEFREQHAEVNWGDIERMRHVLVHGYYKIKPSQVWETIQNDLPVLEPIIEQLYKECQD